MASLPTAAVVTIGTELTTGLRLDTNGAEVTRALVDAGYVVREARSLPDDESLIAGTLAELVARHSLVITTGGLGPTHDDVTRESAARALGRGLRRDAGIEAVLNARIAPHREPASAISLLHQADVIEGARILAATTGTAPGQVLEDGGCTLVLLPGPPHEMRPMLASVLQGRRAAAPPFRLRCVSITESDAQHRVQPVISQYPGIELTLLGAPGEVEVILLSADGDATALAEAATSARSALGDSCYSDDGSTLPEVVVALARQRGAAITTAESCTGGLVAAALTDIPGASDVFLGGIVAYANDVKVRALDIDAGLIKEHGAVSEQVARAMAEGALRLPGATLSVAVTGLAGPGGGSDGKPLGTVCFAIGREGGEGLTRVYRFGGDRAMVRHRAATAALDLLRRALLEA